MSSDFPVDDTAIIIPGPSGDLESIVNGSETHPPSKVAIICHPHSLYGGTMNNKVVTTLARTFKELGFAVVRFNFRGVGKSSGTYTNGDGEADDLRAIIAWKHKTWGEQPLALAGFSFGSYVAAKVAAKIKITNLVLIAPPANHFAFTKLTRFPCPCIILQGELDEIVPATVVSEWVKTVKSPIKLINLPKATHFFHGHLGELKQQLLDQLRTNGKP
jgi:alpha/beta superfamily hydrolase